MKSTSPGILQKRYNALTEPLHLLLQIRAIMGGMSRSLTFELLRTAKIPAPQGNVWNQSDLNTANRTLRELNLTNDRDCCCPELEHHLAVTLAHSMQQAESDECKKSAISPKSVCLLRATLVKMTEGQAHLRVRLRLAVYLRDEKLYAATYEEGWKKTLISENSESQYREPWENLRKTASQTAQFNPALLLEGQFQYLPLEAESWFGTLPASMSLDILSSNLQPFLTEGEHPPCLNWMLQRLPTLRPALNVHVPQPQIILLDILSGRFTEAKEQCVPFMMDKKDMRASMFLGMIAFFEDHIPDALEHFREARKRFRRIMGKRRIQLGGVPGICFALAMLRTKDSALISEVQELIETTTSLSSPIVRGVLSVQSLSLLAGGADEMAAYWTGHMANLPAKEPLSMALSFAVQTIVNSLIRFNNLPDTRISKNIALELEKKKQILQKQLTPDLNLLAELFEQYRETLPLVACIIAEGLAKLKPQPAVYEQFIYEFQPNILFLSFLGNRESWERVFDSLELALCPPSDDESKKQKVRKKRLAWLINPEDPFVEPLEQTSKMTKSGEEWSTGRVASIKRLSEQSTTLDWLTEQDHRVLATVEWVHGWDGVVAQLDVSRAIRELVGHPYLFRTYDRFPLTLRCEDVELVVTQKGSGYRLELSRDMSDVWVDLEEETPTHYCLYLLPKRLTEVARILSEGLEVPAAGAGRVLQLLHGRDPAVPVRTQIRATEFTVEDARPVARLKPLGTGLEIALFVRPFGIPKTDTAGETTKTNETTKKSATAKQDESRAKKKDTTAQPPALPDAAISPVCIPGQGNPRPLATLNGKTSCACRDLEAELTAARDLCRQCPTLREQGGLGPWLIEDTEEALQCLLELQSAPGCAGLEWPEGETLRVRPAVSAAKMSVQVRSSREWFQIQGQIQVSETLILDMRRVLDRLEEAKGCFVPLGDGEFFALTRQFRQQLERLRRLSEPAETRRPGESAKTAEGSGETTAVHKAALKTTLRVHSLGAGAVQDILDQAGSVETDAAWRELSQRIHDAGAAVPVVPSTLRAELRDYQVEGFTWLSRLSRWAGGACLADDMGLGKTVQTIALLLEQANAGPAVIFAPTSVCHNWENELSRFAPTLTCHRFVGARAARAELVCRLGPGDVLVVSYGLLHTETATLAAREWCIAVFDEAQALKNAETKRARASKQIPAAFRVALTGTPIENYLEDLWSLFDTICPGLLGTRQSFQRRFSGPIGTADSSATASASALGGPGAGEARQALKALVRPFILRRTKSAVLTELPPRTEQVVEVELPEDERAFYEALRRKALEALTPPDSVASSGDVSRKFTILTELTRLRRACCHPVLIDPHTHLKGAKLTIFMELVSELVRGGHKALVFSQFVGHLAQVRQALDNARFRYQYLDGSTPERERQRGVKAFQSGEGDLFLISLKAGGQGLNLTAADYVIHLDPWWNPAVEDQASDRAHRMGQERPVTVYRLVIQDSVEENILKLHRSKRSLAADFLEGADVSAALSEKELLDLIGMGT